MKISVQKWGNSLAVRIPKSFAAEVGIDSESQVNISLEKGRLVMAPTEKPRYSLRQLLSKVSSDNIHSEVNTGKAVGGEVW